jgi:hypothetical protein
MLNKYHASEEWKKKEKANAKKIWEEAPETKLLDHEKEYKRLLLES